jgi:hypothetical protein
MAAGLGFKDFATGEVLTAADVDGYLMQGVWVFASAAARDAAVTSPQEGNFAYLKDTNVTTYYTGSAWANLDTTGMTNPMTTTGDTIYSSSGSTPARLGIGTTGQVLTVAGGVPSWATPAGGGGKVLQVVEGRYATEVSNSTTTYEDTGLTATITPSAASSKILVIVKQSSSKAAGSAGTALYVQLLRDATEIDLSVSFYTNSSLTFYGQTSLLKLDSPSTTSAITYKTKFKNEIAAVQVSVQPGTYASTIILMEIGA